MTGGGGAGVTTFATATAVSAADRGVSTRIVGVEPAVVATVLGPPAGRPPALAAGASPTSSITAGDADELLTWLGPFLRWLGLDQSVAAHLPAFPGLRGLLALLGAVEGEPDLAVVDLGPAAEALPLLQLLCVEPSAADSQRAGHLTSRLVGSLVAQAVDLPRPSEAVRGAGRRLAAGIAALHAVVRDPGVTSLRVVVPPDQRAPTLLQDARTVAGLWGIGLDALVERGTARCPAGAAPRTLLVPERADPPLGAAELRRLGDAAYGALAPAARLAETAVPQIEMRGDRADLVLPLPERPPEEFRVGRQGAALHVRAGPWQRTFRLPASLEPLRGRRAWHDGRVFRVRFER
jgi:arsenite/tail-anchored protein-transporting ATPase